MFCKNCGKKTEENVNFCKNCGAKLIDELKPEKPPIAIQAPSKPSERPIAIQIIEASIQLLLLGLFLYLVWYSYGCATGKYPNTGDRACKWFYQTFNGGGSISNGGIKRNGSDGSKCIPTGCGNLWRSSCTNKCYASLSDCRQTGPACSGNVTCRQCP